MKDKVDGVPKNAQKPIEQYNFLFKKFKLAWQENKNMPILAKMKWWDCKKMIAFEDVPK